jgi:predicted dehydrogenase
MNSRILQPSSRPLRVAIVGAGLMGYWHARAAQHLGAELVAVVDPDPKLATVLARKLRIGATAADASDILQKGRIDAVHICSPASSHGSLTCRAIECGIHALVEKPLVESLEETRRLVEDAGRNAVVLCPVHQIAFQDGVAGAAKALAGIGELSMIDIRICSAGESGRAVRELDAVIGEVLPHPLSILRRLWPHISLEPERWLVSSTRPGECMIAGTHAGALLSIAISFHARPTRFEMNVAGSRGSLYLDFFHGFYVGYNGRASRLHKAARPFTIAMKLFGSASLNLLGRGLRGETAYPGLRSLTRAFYAAARGEGPAPIPAQDIIAVAAARDAILIDLKRRLPAVPGATPVAEENSAEQPH